MKNGIIVLLIGVSLLLFGLLVEKPLNTEHKYTIQVVDNGSYGFNVALFDKLQEGDTVFFMQEFIVKDDSLKIPTGNWELLNSMPNYVPNDCLIHKCIIKERR